MFVEDLAAFKDTATGLAWDIVVAGVPGVALDYANPSRDLMGIVPSTDPYIVVDAADFPALAVGQAVTVGSDSFTVAGVYPDESGTVKALLK